jgi:hypothetical protein
MDGVEIDVDSEWYRAFPAAVITEAQHKTNGILNKYIKGGNRVISMVPSVVGI